MDREAAELLEEADKKLKQQDKIIKQMNEQPSLYGTVLGFEQAEAQAKRVIIASSGGLISFKNPAIRGLKTGDQVLMVPGGGILRKVKPLTIGPTTIVTKVVDKERVEVDMGGDPLLVYYKGDVAVDDQVVLDKAHVVVVDNLGKAGNEFDLETVPDVSWDQIGGLESQKAMMREAIEAPRKYADQYRFYKKSPIKGVLLSGPPGCGKTMLAKATATSMATMSNGNGLPSSGYLYVKGPEMLSMWVGNTEASVRRLFSRAREHEHKHGYPAVIFIDEADAILRTRGMGHSSNIMDTVVPMFLAEMDGLDTMSAIVILATNRADMLDPAVIRDGRIDRKIEITRPTKNSAKEIFTIHLDGIPMQENPDELACHATEQLFDCHLARQVNGGMIASIVDQATSFAIQRDIKTEKHSGVCLADFTDSIISVSHQNEGAIV